MKAAKLARIVISISVALGGLSVGSLDPQAQAAVQGPSIGGLGSTGPASGFTAALQGGVVRVTDFGAVPNDGKDDYAAFAAAAAEAKKQGAVLQVPAGAFTLSRLLVLDSVVMEGVSQRKTVIVSTNPDWGSIDLKGSNVGVRNLTHQYEKTIPRGNGANDKNSFTVDGATHFIFDNVTVDKSSTAGVLVRYSSNGQITNSTFKNTGADSIHITHASRDIRIEGNKVLTAGDDGIAVVSYGSAASPVQRVQVINNSVQNKSKARGISVVGGSDITVNDNTIKDTGRAGIYIAAEGGNYNTFGVNNVSVNRNRVTHTGISEPENHPNILVYGAVGVIDNISFTENTIKDGAHRGIGVWGGGTIRTITFTRNTLQHNTRRGAAVTFSNGDIKLIDNKGF